MDTTPFNAWKLVSLSPLPVWALVLLGVGVALGVGLAAWGVRREPVAAAALGPLGAARGRGRWRRSSSCWSPASATCRWRG